MHVTLESIGDAVITTDDKGCVTFLNPVAQLLTGWPYEDARLRKLEEILRLINEQSRATVENPVTKVLREGCVVGLANHTVLIARDGTERQIEDSAAPIQDDQGVTIGVILVFRDVSERRQGEEALRRSEQEHRFLAEASGALATIVDYESTLQKVATLAVPYFADWAAVDLANDDGTLRRLAVMHRDPAQIRLAEELISRYPPDPYASGGIARVLRTGAPEIVEKVTPELLLERAQDAGHLRLMREMALKSYICVPLVVSRKTIGVLTFCTAESDRHYTRRDLALAEDLSHRAAIAIRNTQLYRELREADQRKDEFLATLAHELRNPLAPISNAVQVWPSIQQDAAEMEELRQMMQRQVQHMIRLIDDLMDVSRVTQGRMLLRKECVDLAVALTGACEAVQPLIESCGHQLVVDEPPEPLFVDGDAARLMQIFGNILRNAAKYTGRNGQLRISSERCGDNAVVSIRDNGPGIPRDMLSQIFEMFQQVDQTLDRAHGGLGIGLTLVRRLVELHGGHVEARSEGLGKGSEFLVTLPLLPSAAFARGEVPAPPPQQLAAKLSCRRILVVDDVRASAKTLAMMLRALGQDVLLAFDGPTALESVAANAPEVVFLDIAMPRMDGYEVARRVRESTQFQDLFLVALTGFGQEEDRRRALEAGFNLHLTKPTSIDALRELLSSLPVHDEATDPSLDA